MTRWAWWKARFIELAVALVVVTTVIQLSGEIANRQKELLPASAWFVVNEVYVPDFIEGEYPELIYNRTIRENFNGFWIVEIQSTQQANGGLWTTVCSGSGVNEYDPAEVIPDNTVDWFWLTNTECDMEPGVYRLKITYTMSRPGWPQKRLFVLSNTFRVLGPDGECPMCGRIRTREGDADP